MAESVVGIKITELPEAAQSQLTDASVAVVDDGVTTRKTKLSIFVAWLKSRMVKNNLDQTETGYALDAFQGKVLNDKITELNSALENISGYSKTERKIGTWVNGSPLYEKTVEFSNIDIQNGVILQHGIPGINIVHDVCAIFMDGTVCNPFPIVDERGILLQIMANHSIVRFVGNVSYSAATSRSVRVTLRYTKD